MNPWVILASLAAVITLMALGLAWLIWLKGKE